MEEIQTILKYERMVVVDAQGRSGETMTLSGSGWKFTGFYGEPNRNNIRVVKDSWEVQATADVKGKVRNCAYNLKEWGKKIYGNFSGRIKDCKLELKRLRATNNRREEVIDKVTRKITEAQNEQLLSEVTTKEVKYALFQMHLDKSPGPDGMTPGFFQRHWSIVGDDIVKMVREFLFEGVMLEGLNETNLVLIIKKNNPSTSASIPGRLSSDNILVSYEVMHFLKNKRAGKEGYMAIQLDMSKAYDWLEQDFLKAMLGKMGFNNHWIKFVMVSITYVSYNIVHALMMKEADMNNKYLGLPNLLREKKSVLLGFLKEKLEHKIRGWERKPVSKASQEILIKMVGQSLPTYAMSVFLLPKDLVSKIVKVFTRFGGILSQPWLANIDNSYVTTVSDTIQHNKVQGLMYIDRKEWDQEVVQDLFNHRDQRCILETPICEGEDTIIWKHEISGENTVKSAYRFLHRIQGNFSTDQRSKVLMQLWKIKAPPRVLNVVWRPVVGSLPTLLQLYQRHVQVRPQGNSIKVTVDAALFSERNEYGLGTVARDSDGLLVATKMVCFAGAVISEFAEALTIKEALSWIKDQEWQEVMLESYFLAAVQAIRRKVSMRDLTTVYRPGGIEPYDGARMDQLFYNAPGTEYVPAPRHPDLSEYTFEQIDDLVKAVFHFGDGMEWRWPEPHERVYHRPVGGWVAIPLEHLRSMRPNLHQFTMSLCRDVYGIPFTQLAPNSVKWVSWFLACCHVKKYLPMFKLFHYLFKIKKSTLPPIFEFTFNIYGCGFPPDAKKAPVFMLNSLRGWHQEFIFVRGWDLEFMPMYKTALKNNRFPSETYNQTLVPSLPFLNPFHHAMSQQFKDLAGRFKKIGGAVQLDSGKKKVGAGSGSQARNVGSSGNSVRQSAPVVTTPIVLEPDEVEVLELDEEEVGTLNPRKRKAMEEAVGGSRTPPA
ncbi:hypothetical protein AgCh_001560 [Apium graveolens]